jgi:hypothetical protein
MSLLNRKSSEQSANSGSFNEKSVGFMKFFPVLVNPTVEQATEFYGRPVNVDDYTGTNEDGSVFTKLSIHGVTETGLKLSLKRIGLACKSESKSSSGSTKYLMPNGDSVWVKEGQSLEDVYTFRLSKNMGNNTPHFSYWREAKIGEAELNSFVNKLMKISNYSAKTNFEDPNNFNLISPEDFKSICEGSADKINLLRTVIENNSKNGVYVHVGLKATVKDDKTYYNQYVMGYEVFGTRTDKNGDLYGVDYYLKGLSTDANNKSGIHDKPVIIDVTTLGAVADTNAEPLLDNQSAPLVSSVEDDGLPF